jgi:hypothetical protein
MDLSFIKTPQELKIELNEPIDILARKYERFRADFYESLKQALYQLCENPQSVVCIHPLLPGVTHVPSEFQQLNASCDWDEFLNIPQIVKKCYQSGYLFISTNFLAKWNLSDRRYWISQLGHMPPCTSMTLEELTKSLDWTDMPQESKQVYINCYKNQLDFASKLKQDESFVTSQVNVGGCIVM